MHVLVLTGSHRRHSNSSALAEKFIEGATTAGHQVKRFDCALHNIGGCLGCNFCKKGDGSCCQKDDFALVRQDILDADVIVFASPIYYYGLSAQLKAVIDRFYAIDEKIHGNKHVYLLLSYADTALSTADASETHVRAFCQYLDWNVKGVVRAHSLTAENDIQGRPELENAYAMGLNLAR